MLSLVVRVRGLARCLLMHRLFLCLLRVSLQVMIVVLENVILLVGPHGDDRSAGRNINSLWCSLDIDIRFL